MTQRTRIDASLDCEINALKLCYRTEIIFLIVLETNRKAIDVRHQYGVLPNLVHKDFTIEEVEAGIAIMIRAGLDKNNFTDLRRLCDPIDSRPFYLVTMPLNLFKFLLRCMRFNNYRNRPGRQADDRLAAIRKVWSIFNDNLRNIYIPNIVVVVVCFYLHPKETIDNN